MRKRFFASLLSLCMVVSLLPGTAFAAGETDSYEALKTAIEAAPKNGTMTTVTLKGDITGMKTDQILTIAQGQNVKLDLAGHSITVESNFEGRPIVNEGTLTVTGNGTIDSSASANGGYGAINNRGTLTVENGTYKGALYASGSCIRNTGKDANLVIKDGTFTDATCAVFNEGTAVIYNGKFDSKSCSACAKDDGHEGMWSYTIRNYLKDAKMTINGGTFTGTQGAVSASIGYFEVNGGTFKTVDCSKNHGAIFYALYAAGEAGEVECVINDGTFETEGTVAAVSIGNDNTNGDGGINAQATAHVNGGTFKAPDGVPALLGATNTGDPIITGGEFSSDISKYVPDGYTVKEESGIYEVGAKVATDGNDVAQVGSQYFATLAGAVAAAKSGDTVKLLKDVVLTDSVRITNSTNVTLNLNNHTISKDSTPFIVYGGTLNVTGTGTITETESDKLAAIMVFGSSDESANNYSVVSIGENVTLGGWAPIFVNRTNADADSNGWGVPNTQDKACGVKIEIKGTLVSPAKTEHVPGHGVYVNGTIANTTNYPVITIGDTADITSKGAGVYAAGYAQWNVSGKINGVLSGIEIRAGVLNVADGAAINATATPTEVTANGNGTTSSGAGIAIAQHTTKLPIQVNISGGEINGYSALYESTPETDPNIDEITLSVTGGAFKAINGGTVAVYSEDCKDFIEKGIFSSDPSDYCVENWTGVANTDNSTNREYPFTVGKANTEAPAVVAAGKPDVKSELSDSATEAEKTLAESAAAALAPADSSVASAAIAGAGIEAAAKEIANDNTEKGDAYKDQLNTEEDVKIVVQHYMDIQVTDATSTDAEKSLTLDITPMYRKVATTVDPSTDPSTEIKTDGDDKNAVQITTGELAITGPVTLTLPLPTDFASDNATVYIQHKGYEYTATVTSNVITFVNPHGFSEFTISTKSIAVAKIDDTSYTSLQAAVAAVENGETITLLAADQKATVSKTVTFKVANTGNNNFSAEITGGSRTTVNQSEPDGNGVTTYTCTRSSGGSGGGVTTYAITMGSPANGTVTASPKSAAKDATVTLTVTPTEGYQLDKLTVVDKDGKEIALTDKGDGKYTYVMPASKVEVTATFKQAPVTHVCPAEKYTDVDTTQWYHEGVDYVIANGMMNGTGTNIFEPNSTTTRGMIVTILYRLEKEPSAGTSPFTDVDASQWYAKAVAWAAENGVVNGTSPTTFNPNDPITREQMAAILYRYASFKGYDVTGKADLAGFTDAAQISDYAKDPMAWANKAGLIGGVSADTLQPQGSATRAQVATILMRFCENVAK